MRDQELAQLEADLPLVLNAMGDTNADRQRIAEQGVMLVAKLLRKNADYGSSAFKRPRLSPALDAGEAIKVRMSDKLERLESLAGKDPQVAGESWEDTLMDLAGYIVLYFARPAQRPPAPERET